MQEISKQSAEVAKVQKNARIVAPDLARGLALLGIAMANIPTAWLRPPQDQMAAMLGGVLNNSILDKVAAMFGALFVHVRGLPMFSFLLGYGVGMLALSLHRRGYPSLQARKVLIRRYGFLAFFGFLHSFFIFFGDIMFSYGVLGIFLVLMMRWRTQSLIVVAITLYSMYALSMMAVALTTVFMPDGGFALPQPTVGFRLPVTWNEYVISGVYATFNQFTILIPSFFFLLPLMMMGFVAARHQVLEKPQEHLKLLKTTVAVGVLVILVVGIPWGLSELEIIPGTYKLAFFLLNQGFGILTGPAIIAFVALATIPLQRKITEAHEQGVQYKLPLFIQMCVALGKRSMTGYVLQSLVLFPLCAPFLLHLLQPRGAAFSMAVGFCVWLFTLLVAYVLERMGKRGPFEVVHRRLSYGKLGLAEHYPQSVLPEAAATPAQELGAAASKRTLEHESERSAQDRSQ